MSGLKAGMRIRTFLPTLLWIVAIQLLPSEAYGNKGQLLTVMERKLLLRDPSQGLIQEKEIKRFPISASQKKIALRLHEQFKERVPLDGSKVFWIDRFHRDLYRAIQESKTSDEPLAFAPVEKTWNATFGHQSEIFMRPDGLPLRNSISSPFMEADLSILFSARELPRYGSLQLEFYGHRREMERKSLIAYDLQTMGVSLSFLKAMDELKIDIEQSFFGTSASRPGGLKGELSWVKKRELVSGVLNGTVFTGARVSHLDLRGQAELDQTGDKKDRSSIEFSLEFESLPFSIAGGKARFNFGSKALKDISDSEALDRLGVEPGVGIVWTDHSGTYEFESRFQHLVYVSQKDALGDRNDQLFTWEGKLQRHMSDRWSLHGGWELQKLSSDQAIYDQSNEVLFFGMDGNW